MYYKIRNTLVGLGVALSMVGLSYSVGAPPVEPTTATIQPSGQEVGAVDSLRERSRVMRSQLSMPFFSFAPLIPRGES